MRSSRRSFIAMALVAVSFLLAAEASAQAPLKVVASFSILADMVKNIGGEHVEVTTLVGPDGDAHVYQPTPADARAVATARVLVVNGFDFEGWMGRLVKATNFKGVHVVATRGVSSHSMIEIEEGKKRKVIDPHAWQDLQRGMTYVRNIADGLASADPARAEQYKANAEAYLGKLRELDAWIVAELAAIPKERRKVITSHDAFAYFGRRYGITFRAPVGVSTESEASAKDVAALITQIRKESIRAIFVENMSDPRLLQQLASEAEAAVGGTLYADALSGPSGPASSYIDMFRHNVTQLVTAMRSN